MAMRELARGDETKRRILDAAGRVFAEKGYHGASLGDLMAATGLTKGALYFHFPSKEALALASFAHVQERWVGAVVRATDPAASAIAQLEAMLREAVRFAEQEPAAWCTSRLSMELAEEERLRPMLAPHITRWEEMVAMLVRRGQAEGDLRDDVEPELAARVAVAAFIGSEHTSQATSGGADLRERAEDVLTFFLSSLGRPEEALR